MAIIQTRHSASTVETLRTRVRRKVGDRDTNTARQRWSNADIDQALIDQMFLMYNELSEDPANYMLSTTMTYTASSGSVSMPAAVHANPIYKVEDYTNSANPQEIIQIAHDAAETYTVTNNPYGAGRVWARADTSILVRPTPSSALTLRIWYVGSPFSPYTYSSGSPSASAPTTDQHPLSVAHEELLVLGAAIRLQEEDDEVPVIRMQQYESLWLMFQKTARLFRGKRFVKTLRKLH